jgi:hypothetical protein
LVATTTAGVAFAEPSQQDIAQARELGGQAQAAFEAGNYAESEKLWVSAASHFNAPTITLGLARTQVKLGKLLAARESYNRMIRENVDTANLSPAFKEALESAKTEGAALAPRIANVLISVEGASSAQVTLDGQPVPAAELGVKRPTDPGSHVVRAEAPGYKAAEMSFQLAEGGMAETKLKLEKDVVAAAPVDTGKAVEADTSKGGNKTLAYVALGVGGVGIAVGAITGIVAIGKHGTLKDKCPDGKCPDDAKSDVDSYKTMGTLSTVGFIVGGVGIAAGAVLWLTAPSDSASAPSSPPSPAAKSRFTWHPYVGLGGGGVTGRF